MQFYFHIHDRNRLIADREGMTCRDIAEAHAQAVAAMLEFVVDGAWNAASHAGRYVSISDKTGEEIEKALMWEAVERLADFRLRE